MLQQVIQQNRLPLLINIFDINYLPLRLRFPLDAIKAVIENKESHVSVFKIKIPKKDGSYKEREICNPSPDYKTILKRINTVILNKAVLAPGVCGGIKGRTIIDMVDMHCGKEAVYKIDLTNFYPSIKVHRIKKLLISLKTSPEVAELLADIFTYKGVLPQGFPTSTMIANLVANSLDQEHLKICEQLRLDRTRWVDDIAFSGRISDLEKAIPEINEKVKNSGFILNKKKCLFSRRQDKNVPTIVGLTVNKHKPYIPEKLIEIVETVLIVAKENVENARQVYVTEFPAKSKTNLKQSISGKINYIAKFNKMDAERLLFQFQEVNW